MIIQANAMHIPLADNSVQCVVTSPPYWGLRDYGTARWEGGDDGCDHAHFLGGNGAASAKQVTSVGTQKYQFRDQCGKCGATRIDSQLGLEATPELYVEHMVAVFAEVWRVLRDDGTCWVNLGDSYAGTHTTYEGKQNKWQHGEYPGRQEVGQPNHGLKTKDLVGIPWRVAFALQAAGWYLRSDIIWSKPNPMPESVTDRPTKAHEYIFLLSKKERYYFDQDAVREKADEEVRYAKTFRHGKYVNNAAFNNNGNLGPGEGQYEELDGHYGRNIRTVWEIATQPYPDAHFATFPEEIAKRCIMAGTSEKGACVECGAPWERVVESAYERPSTRPSDPAINRERYNGNTGGVGYRPEQVLSKTSKTLGWQPTCKCADSGQPTAVSQIVLDPFCGSGTVVQVAQDLGRIGIGLDIKPEYLKMAKLRAAQMGLRLEGGAVA